MEIKNLLVLMNTSNTNSLEGRKVLISSLLYQNITIWEFFIFKYQAISFKKQKGKRGRFRKKPTIFSPNIIINACINVAKLYSSSTEIN